MKKLVLAISPIVIAAVVFALSGVAGAQSKSGSSSSFGHDLSSGRNAPSTRESGTPMAAAINCPPPHITTHKITEIEAMDLAQQYADKNLKDYKLVKPTTNSGGRTPHSEPAYGGGYNTVCYSKDGEPHHSVEYSFDAKNSKGSMRTLIVDQFGSVRQYRETESAAR